jgi:peptidoglycan/xylan/chitin deacetylase (PgdA/CDA1 family)
MSLIKKLFLFVFCSLALIAVGNGGIWPESHVVRASGLADPVNINIPILAYHKILDRDDAICNQFSSGSDEWTKCNNWLKNFTQVDEFRKQMDVVQALGYTTVTLQDYMNYVNGTATPPAKPIILTFDDGWQDFYTNARPILKARGQTATVFVLPSYTADTEETRFDDRWNNSLPPVDCKEEPVPAGKLPCTYHMLWSEIQTLYSEGFQIESHTKQHYNLAGLADANNLTEITNQIDGSKQAIISHLPLDPVNFFAYPFGKGLTKASVTNQLIASGYQAAVAYGFDEGGYDDINNHDAIANPATSSLFALPRRHMNRGITTVLNPKDPWWFVMRRLDPDYPVPNLAVTSAIEFYDISNNLRSTFFPGETVRADLKVFNYGYDITAVGDLEIYQNGSLIYTSHPDADITRTFNWSNQTLSYTFQLPDDAAYGSYDYRFVVRDASHLLTYYSTQANDVFTVPAPSFQVNGSPVLYDNASVKRSRFYPGETVRAEFNVSNSGSSVAAIGDLEIYQSGILVYTSHPAADVTHTVGGIGQIYSYTFQLPGDAVYGPYDYQFKVYDQAHASTYLDTQGNSLFKVQAQPVNINIPILAYHKIMDQNDAICNQFTSGSSNWSKCVEWLKNFTNVDEFRKQMDVIQALGFTTITLQDYMNYMDGTATPPAKPIILTFDDGWQDFYTNARPILLARGQTATVFILPNYTGNTENERVADKSWNNDPIPPDDCTTVPVPAGKLPCTYHLIWSEIQTLYNEGFQIESHTKQHYNLAGLADVNNLAEITAQIDGSRQAIISQMPGNPVNFFAYPFGKGMTYDSVKDQLVSSGYQAAVAYSLDEKGNDNDRIANPATTNDLFVIPRRHMNHGVTTVLDPNNPWWFFSRRLDPNTPIPKLALSSAIAFYDTGNNLRTTFFPGETVRAELKIVNYLDTITAVGDFEVYQNGNLVYTSHPDADITRTFNGSNQTLSYTFQLPDDAAYGSYDYRFIARDSTHLITYYSTQANDAFSVPAPSFRVNGSPILYDSMGSIRTQYYPNEVLRAELNVDNSGSPVSAIGQLEVYQNGNLFYTSHPAADVTHIRGGIGQTYSYTFQLPENVVYGQYDYKFKVFDPSYTVTYLDIQANNLFSVPAPTFQLNNSPALFDYNGNTRISFYPGETLRAELKVTDTGSPISAHGHFELYQAGKLFYSSHPTEENVRDFKPNVPHTLTYEWKIPFDIPVGAYDFRFVVIKEGQTTHEFQSEGNNLFVVQQPQISVSSNLASTTLIEAQEEKKITFVVNNTGQTRSFVYLTTSFDGLQVVRAFPEKKWKYYPAGSQVNKRNCLIACSVLTQYPMLELSETDLAPGKYTYHLVVKVKGKTDISSWFKYRLSAINGENAKTILTDPYSGPLDQQGYSIYTALFNLTQAHLFFPNIRW